MQTEPSIVGQGWVVEAAQMFIDYLFACQDFSKLYAEVYEFSLTAFLSALGDAFEIEGCLKHHERFAGTTWDLYTLALYKTRWQEQRSRVTKPEITVVSEAGSAIDFDIFISLIAKELNFDQFELEPSTRLHEDLGFDSIQMFELIDLLESLGCLLDGAAISTILTLADVHYVFIQHFRNRPLDVS